ncbi:hypothetical protein BDV97DRAFT_395131 [Delphinella strobiligena]|nr:hypothetical protein BDV97DRAFT_395131 [Delphinella strobiligena]
MVDHIHGSYGSGKMTTPSRSRSRRFSNATVRIRQSIGRRLLDSEDGRSDLENWLSTEEPGDTNTSTGSENHSNCNCHRRASSGIVHTDTPSPQSDDSIRTVIHARPGSIVYGPDGVTSMASPHRSPTTSPTAEAKQRRDIWEQDSDHHEARSV